MRRNKGNEPRLQPPYENNIPRCSASGYVDDKKFLAFYNAESLKNLSPKVEIRTKAGYTVLLMAEKRTDKNSTRSHKKPRRSFAKHLTRFGGGVQNSQLHSFTASQLHSFTASQLRANCAQIKLHSNTYDFSHPITRLRRNVCATLRPRRFLSFITLQTTIMYKEIVQ